LLAKAWTFQLPVNTQRPPSVETTEEVAGALVGWDAPGASTVTGAEGGEDNAIKDWNPSKNATFIETDFLHHNSPRKIKGCAFLSTPTRTLSFQAPKR
jgi:hypothetical protein